ncbi:MAG: zf-HC2 domain-containing protein, partial [Firmicutes bacterium]|nr:zf-HC2 domain-containing protein [Bacillota bacterium]
MNKLPCYIVRDMLPQYAEDLLGEESKRDIEQHLEECQDCKELYRQMTSPEPEIEVDTAEVDYLKKVKKNRSRIITAAIVIVALVAVGAFVNSRIQAAKATFNFDEASKTLVIYGKDDTDIKIPKTIHEATELDAQFDTFHLKVHLPFLRNGDTVLEDYLPAYLGRTNESLKFLRDYLKEHSNNEGLIERAEKFVDLSIAGIDDYSWSEQDDRIELKVGDYYWHREEVYVLSLLGKKSVQWKQLGYAWYVGACIDPYNETINMNFLENIKDLPY